MPFILFLLAALYVALNVLDAILTRACIQSGRGYERNAIMAWLISRMGLVPALSVKVGLSFAVAVLVFVAYPPAAPLYSVLTLLVLNAFYVWVCLNNYRILKS